MADLGTLLENLSTQEGRAKVVRERIGLRDEIPEQYITKAIDFFEEKGKKYTHILTEGAELARKAGRENKAIEIYKKAINRETKEGDLGYAANIADEAQMFERAIGLHFRASRKKEKEESFYYAAKQMEKASNSARDSGKAELTKRLDNKAKTLFVRTIDNFEINSSDNNEEILKKIQEITKKAGMPEKIPELYEAVIKDYEKGWEAIPGAGYEDAAIFAEKIGMCDRAKELNLLAIEGFAEGNHYKAIELAKKIDGVKELSRGLKEKILTLMEKERPSNEVAEVAEKMGLTDKAREYYIKAMESSESQGNFRKCAKIAKKLEMHDKAKLYKKLATLIGKDYLF